MIRALQPSQSNPVKLSRLSDIVDCQSDVLEVNNFVRLTLALQ